MPSRVLRPTWAWPLEDMGRGASWAATRAATRAATWTATWTATWAAILVTGASGGPPATGPDREPLRLEGPGEAGLQLLANRDDDDADGRPDADDDRVNGPADLADLARLVVRAADPRLRTVRLEAGGAPLRFFARSGDGWRPLDEGAAVPLAGGEAELRVECRDWARPAPGWGGRATIVAIGDRPGGEPARASLEAAAMPVELVPETAAAREVYVARGRYDNDRFVAALREVLTGLDLPLVVHEAGRWEEMWMQDTMEIAASSLPGKPGGRMTVVLAGLRGADPFPERLLGPDVAVARVATPRTLAGGDAWADWYGNLTVSPPTPAWPRGRVIHGRNLATAAGFHPEAIAFLAAQRAQPPVWIDTSWLLIKHVDEVVAFLPGADGKGAILVPDPLAGLAAARAAGLPAAVGPRADEFAAANRRLAAMIDEVLAGGGSVPRAGGAGRGDGPRAEGEPAGGLLALLGLGADRVVRLPVAFAVPAGGEGAGLSGAEAVWSNPVNMLFVGGTVICGRAAMPEAVIDACRERFLAAGADEVVFLDDACYHRAKGNVHCGTNVRRE